MKHYIYRGGIKMSYSVISKCNVCTKGAECVDSAFIYGAVCGIHQVNWMNVTGGRKYHLGSGSIEIQCQNFDDAREEATTETKEEAK